MNDHINIGDLIAFEIGPVIGEDNAFLSGKGDVYSINFMSWGKVFSEIGTDEAVDASNEDFQLANLDSFTI